MYIVALEEGAALKTRENLGLMYAPNSETMDLTIDLLIYQCRYDFSTVSSYFCFTP